jgi:ferric-dicitrate binding protein FerR (iron transport regulator)
MNSKTDINELLAKHFANERLTASQQEELNEWISAHRDEYRRLQKLIGASVGKPKGISFDAERAWQKVEAQLEERSQKVIPFRRKMLFWTSMAASLLIVLAVSVFYFSSASDEEMVRYANVGRTEQHCLLPDSSEVILYPEAVVTYQHTDKGRLARLEGKAFFQVKRKIHGVPFKVETNLLKVEVLGTSFLVDATSKKQAAVFVKSGKVRVKTDESGAVLEANEKAEWKDGRLEVGIIEDPQALFGEAPVVLVFSATPLPDVVRDIENKTGVRIELEAGLEKNLITTRIESESAQDMVEELAFLCGCKYKTLTEGKHYRLYEE